jgi:hypothetical protein
MPSTLTGSGTWRYALDDSLRPDTLPVPTANLTGQGRTGGNSAFSTTTLMATCVVNKAPVLDSSTITSSCKIYTLAVNGSIGIAAKRMGVSLRASRRHTCQVANWQTRLLISRKRLTYNKLRSQASLPPICRCVRAGNLAVAVCVCARAMQSIPRGGMRRHEGERHGASGNITRCAR